MKHKISHYSLLLFTSLFLSSGAFAQNVGIGTAAPVLKLHVQANGAADGVIVDNIAANGDPILQYRVNGTSRITMGIDDSDADKFKIGTTALTTNTRMTILTTGQIGIRTTTPGNLLHMTNGGVTIGATSMANFENLSASGVSIQGRNNNTTSGYNAIEGLTDYNGTGFTPAGVFGLALYNGTVQSPTIGVRGHSNEWQGTGVRGSRFNGGGPDNGFGGQFYDDVGYTGGLFNISDKRTKKNIQPLAQALSLVTQLNPVSYQYDTEKYPNMGLNDGEEFGFIAQEVAAVAPHLTATKTFDVNACIEVAPNSQSENHTEDFMVVDYVHLVPVLTQAIKEQQTQIQDLQQEANRVGVLESEVELLRRELDALRQQINNSSGNN